MEASFYYLLFHTISSQILVDYYASEVMPDYEVLHFLVLIEKSISAIFILRSKIKQKEREDGWTPASQSMKGPSSHE